MQKDSVNLFVAEEDRRSFLAAYDEWMQGLGETGYKYLPQRPGKLDGNILVGVSFNQVPRAFLRFLDAKKIRYEEFRALE